MTYSDMISKADKPAAVSDDVIRGAYFVKDLGAESVAKIISDLVNGGKIFDKGVERPIKYSDFLLLLWNTTQMEFLFNGLDRSWHTIYNVGQTSSEKQSGAEKIYCSCRVRF